MDNCTAALENLNHLSLELVIGYVQSSNPGKISLEDAE